MICPDNVSTLADLPIYPKKTKFPFYVPVANLLPRFAQCSPEHVAVTNAKPIETHGVARAWHSGFHDVTNALLSQSKDPSFLHVPWPLRTFMGSKISEMALYIGDHPKKRFKAS